MNKTGDSKDTSVKEKAEAAKAKAKEAAKRSGKTGGETDAKEIAKGNAVRRK